MYSDIYGLDVVVLRVGDQYGPELTPPTTLRMLLRCAADGEPFQAPAGADHQFHLTHGEDICRAVIAALDAKAPTQRVYNISGGETHSLAQVVALVRERFPKSRIDLGPGHLPGLDRQGGLDIRAADRELGYRPIWGLARGLDDYAEWLLARREAA
jgi:nucleoside-diphosphate-sugar epimerase